MISNAKKLFASFKTGPKIVAIDGGTTNTVLCGVTPEGVKTYKDEKEKLIPSVIRYEEYEILIGNAAKVTLEYDDNLENTIYEYKRIMGMTLESMGQTMFDSLRNDLTYRIDASEIEQPFVDDNNGNTDEEHEKYEIKIHVNRGENIVQMTASDVFADHLRHIRENVLEKKIDDGDPTAQGANKYRLVVLTHPAFYSVEQKRATRRAAIRAGFPTDKLRMITEPEAAALLFCNSWQGIEGGPILVYDMGGGTFDLAIVEISRVINGWRTKLIAYGGDRFFGGRDYDRMMVDFFNKRLMEQEGAEYDVTLQENYHWRQKLRHACIAVKERLSSNTVAKSVVPLGRRNHTFWVQMTRDDFNTMTRPLMDRAIELVLEFIAENGFEPQDFLKVSVVGGSSRFPYILQRLNELGFKVSEKLDMDEAIAHGAAIYGAYLAQDKSLPNINVREIVRGLTCRIGLAIVVADNSDQCFPIFDKGQKFPCKQILDCIEPYSAIQANISVQIYEAVSTDLSECRFISGVNISLNKWKRGEMIRMEFTLDEDGLLEINTFNSESGNPLESKQMSIRKDRGEEVDNIVRKARIFLREGKATPSQQTSAGRL